MEVIYLIALTLTMVSRASGIPLGERSNDRNQTDLQQVDFLKDDYGEMLLNISKEIRNVVADNPDEARQSVGQYASNSDPDALDEDSMVEDLASHDLNINFDELMKVFHGAKISPD